MFETVDHSQHRGAGAWAMVDVTVPTCCISSLPTCVPGHMGTWCFRIHDFIVLCYRVFTCLLSTSGLHVGHKLWNIRYIKLITLHYHYNIFIVMIVRHSLVVILWTVLWSIINIHCAYAGLLYGLPFSWFIIVNYAICLAIIIANYHSPLALPILSLHDQYPLGLLSVIIKIHGSLQVFIFQHSSGCWVLASLT